MDFDIKATIAGIVDKLKNDPSLIESFTKEPEKTVERVAGTDIPDGTLNAVVDGVKGLIGTSGGGLGDIIGGLFGKKD